MSTWHQQQNPVRLWHETKWTVVTDPPGMPMVLERFENARDADASAAVLPHSYVLRPHAKGAYK